MFIKALCLRPTFTAMQCVYYYRIRDSTVRALENLEMATEGLRLWVQYCQHMGVDDEYHGRFKARKYGTASSARVATGLLFPARGIIPAYAVIVQGIMYSFLACCGDGNFRASADPLRNQVCARGCFIRSFYQLSRASHAAHTGLTSGC